MQCSAAILRSQPVLHSGGCEANDDFRADEPAVRRHVRHFDMHGAADQRPCDRCRWNQRSGRRLGSAGIPRELPDLSIVKHEAPKRGRKSGRIWNSLQRWIGRRLDCRHRERRIRLDRSDISPDASERGVDQGCHQMTRDE
jgi:hypothetical protein